MRLHFRFLGGPQNGKTLPVPSPVALGMEISVRPEEPYLPCAQYRLAEDGTFRFVELPESEQELELEACPSGA